MKKRYIIVIIIACILLVYYKSTSFKFNLNNNEISSIEYTFDDYNNGIGYIEGEILDIDTIKNTIKYLNKLSLPKTLIHTKGATQYICFKDKNGNVIKGYNFGCGNLWYKGNAYSLNETTIDKIKKLLHVYNEN